MKPKPNNSTWEPGDLTTRGRSRCPSQGRSEIRGWNVGAGRLLIGGGASEEAPQVIDLFTGGGGGVCILTYVNVDGQVNKPRCSAFVVTVNNWIDVLVKVTKKNKTISVLKKKKKKTLFSP